MSDLIRTFLVALSGAVLLSAFYRMVESRWPENYFTTSQLVEYTISSKWLRYAAFRLLPPYMTAVFIGSICIRLDISMAWTLALCAILHLSSTALRATVTYWKNNEVRRRLLLAHGAIVVSVTLAFVAAALTASWWFKYIPGPDKYVEVIATGAVAAAFVYYLQRLTSGGVDVGLVVKRFRKWLSKDLEKHIDLTCAQYRVDHDLAMAVIITEWAQRPLWVRSVENTLGAVGVVKTYGIMQSTRRRGISDKESITVGIKNLNGAVLPRPHGPFFREALAQYHLERHNKGAEFAEFALSIMSTDPSGYSYSTPYVANDGRAGVRCRGAVRDGEWWTISGDLGNEITGITIRLDDDEDDAAMQAAIESAEYGRRRWSFRFPLYVEKVTVYGLGELPERPREPTDCSIEIGLS